MTEPWRFSLHGGHPSESSRHATSNIAELIAAAEAADLASFDLVAHQPRLDVRFLYEEERAEGLTPDHLAADYARFLERSADAIAGYAGPVRLLRGLELENLPPLGSWPLPEDATSLEAAVSGWRDDRLDFVVGSAHWVRGLPIDVDRAQWEVAAEACGGADGLIIRYYDELDTYLGLHEPDIAGHLDVIRHFAPSTRVTETPAARAAVDQVLRTVIRIGALLEVNPSTAVRGMIEEPYPAGWIVERARDLGCAFTFGDDSHSAGAVGTGLKLARAHLLRHKVTTLQRGDDGVERVIVPLE